MKEVNEKYMKKIYLNILKAIIIVTYFLVLNLACEKVSALYLERGIELCTMVFLIIAIGVFEMAYKNSFKTIKKQKLRPTDLYVSFNENDLYVEIENISIKELMLKVRAFNVGSKLIKVNINNKNYDLIRVEIIKNKYLNSKMGKYKNLEVVFEYENNLLIKKDNKFLKLCYRK